MDFKLVNTKIGANLINVSDITILSEILQLTMSAEMNHQYVYARPFKYNHISRDVITNFDIIKQARNLDCDVRFIYNSLVKTTRIHLIDRSQHRMNTYCKSEISMRRGTGDEGEFGTAAALLLQWPALETETAAPR